MKTVCEQFDSDHAEPGPLPDKEMNSIITSIHNKYNDGLYKFLRQRLGSKEDVDDVVQEVYLRLIRYPILDQLKPSFAFLYRIASNILKDRYRKKCVRKEQLHISIEEVDLAAKTASPEEVVTSKEGFDILSTVFEKLNDKSRQAFVLHRFQGHTYKEIGKIMGISRSMVKRHISNVLRTLDKNFEKYL